MGDLGEATIRDHLARGVYETWSFLALNLFAVHEPD